MRKTFLRHTKENWRNTIRKLAPQNAHKFKKGHCCLSEPKSLNDGTHAQYQIKPQLKKNQAQNDQEQEHPKAPTRICRGWLEPENVIFR